MRDSNRLTNHSANRTVRPRRRPLRRKPPAVRRLQLESLEGRHLLTSLFVATDGDDASGDGSLNAPFRTVQHAVGAADPGDVIELRAGTYEGNITISEPDITLRSYAGEWAVIQSPIDDPDHEQVIRFRHTADRGHIQNLELIGGYYYAVKADSNWDWGVPDHERNGAEGLLIEDSKLHGSGRDAIKLTPGSDDVVIRRNEIYNTGMRYSGNAEGIDNVNCDRMLVQDNYFHDIATNAVYFKGGSIDSVVERNLIVNTGFSGVAVGYYTDHEWFDLNANPDLFESINGVVRNNIIVGTQAAGIGFYGSQGAQVYNNTLIDVGESMQAGVIFSAIDHYVTATEIVVRGNVDPTFANNIVVMSGNSGLHMVHMRENSLSGPLHASNNLYHDLDGEVWFGNRLDDPSSWRFTLAEWQTMFGDAGSLVADPLLDANQHLTIGSPAIDSGALLPMLLDDYDGNGRELAIDIGADEFATGPALAVPPPAGTVGTGGGGGIVLPAFRFDATGYFVDEDAGTLTVTVERTGDLSGLATVDFATTDGTASAGADYGAASGTLTFAAGDASQSLTVVIHDDSSEEADESFAVTLSNPTGGVTLNGAASVGATIVDDDRVPIPGSLQFSLTEYQVSEGAATATIEVERIGGADGSVTVDYTTSDVTAAAGSDYAPAVGTLMFAAGETSQVLQVPIINDSLFEGPESLQLFLANPTGGASLGSTTVATLVIDDNDVPPPATFSFAVDAYTVDEDGQLQVSIQRAGDTSGPSTITMIARTVNGAPNQQPAYGGSDFNWPDTVINFAAGQAEATVEVPLIDDAAAEPNEYFRLLLTEPSGGSTVGDQGTALIEILDDESEVALANWQYTVDEADGAASVTIRRVGDVSGIATVDYTTVNMSATAGSDFAATQGTLNFAPGETEHVVEIPLIHGSEIEPQEQFGFSLGAVTGDSTLGRDWAYIVINDSPPAGQPGTLQFSAAAMAASEGEGTATVTVSRVGGASGPVSVDFSTAAGSATAGVDYTATAGTLHFADGVTTQTFVIPIADDTLPEGEETIELVLGNPTGGAATGLANATLTIVDNDTAPAGPPTFSLANDLYQVSEVDGSLQVLIHRDGDVSQQDEVQLLFRAGGPNIPWQQWAYAGQDYQGQDMTVEFAAGESVKAINIPLIDDAWAEGTEFFNVQLVQPSAGAELGDVTQAVVAIEDDESEVRFGSWQYVHGEGAGAATIVVQRVGDLSGTATVDYTTVDMTALAGSDYVALSGTLTFLPGEAEKLIQVPLTDDSSNEPTEQFGVALSNLVGDSTLGRAWTYSVIEDNDQADASSSPASSASAGSSGTGFAGDSGGAGGESSSGPAGPVATNDTSEAAASDPLAAPVPAAGPASNDTGAPPADAVDAVFGRLDEEVAGSLGDLESSLADLLDTGLLAAE